MAANAKCFFPDGFVKKCREMKEPIGMGIWNAYNCPTCGALSGKWCKDERNGRACDARFTVWVRLGKPAIVVQPEPLQVAMILATQEAASDG